jgi:peptide-methionine (S)-S-oxide reductase
MVTTDLIRRYLISAGAGLLLVLGGMTSAAASAAEETAVFAGGCFWGVDAVFKHVKGVTDVTSGYAGGGASTAHYGQVSTGETGHAESVRVRYNPAQISYRQLLKIFFGVAHDPTELNRQGPDIGSQYRSAILFHSDEQKTVATQFLRDAQPLFEDDIVTQLAPVDRYYRAETYHQEDFRHNPTQGYCMFVIGPKLEKFRRTFARKRRAGER